MTVKRRTVWMSDRDWTELLRRAQAVNESPSRYLAALVEGGPILKMAVIAGPILREDVDDIYGGVAPAGRTVIEPGGFNTRPFTPVPKTKPKR